MTTETSGVQQTDLTVKDKPGEKKKKRGRGLTRRTWILAAVLLMIGLVYWAASKTDLTHLLQPEVLWSKLGRPVLRTTLFISIGLLVGQLIESLGWTARLGRLVWPLINWARLPGAAGAAFTSAFISGVMANTLLLTAWKEGRLNSRTLLLSNLLNSSIPAYVLHMPTTMFVIISLTGRAGMIYVGLTFSAAILRLLGVVIVGRITMPPCEACSLEEAAERKPWGEVWADTWPKFKTRLMRVIIIILPVYMVVVLVAEAGFFDWLEKSLAGWVSGTVVSIESMSVIIFAVVAEFTSGFAAAGALLQSGALTVKSVVLALLIGNIVATPVRALRHQLPHYMGIYSPSVGAKLLFIGQSVRITSIILVACIYYVLV